MLKKKFIIIATSIIIFSFSCKENKEVLAQNVIYASSTLYYPDKMIDSISKIFLDSAKCKDCINELFIDKTYEGEAYFTFKCWTYYKGYFKKNAPTFYYYCNNKRIFIYTGAEDFIKGNLKAIDSLKIPKDTTANHYLLMEFHLENKKLELLQMPNLPFSVKSKQVVIDTSIKFDPSKLK